MAGTSSSRPYSAVRAVALGLAATMLVLLARPLLEGLEQRWTDLRFRKLPTIAPGDEIVHVDIDDASLEQIGRWPWPRRKQAQLVAALTDAGAELVVLDILLPHPQAPRYVKEGVTDLYAGISGELLAADAPPTPVLDDVELAAELAASDSVFLAMHVDIALHGRETPRHRRLEDRLIELATTRPGISRGQAAAELGADADEMAPMMATARQEAFGRRIGAVLAERGDASLAEAMTELFGPSPPPPGSEDFEIAARAYLRRRGLAEMRRFALPDGAVAGADLPRGRVVPPLVTFGEVLAHTGYATATPDADGIFRRIPLLVRADGEAHPQLALAVAAEVFARQSGQACRIEAAPGRVLLRCGGQVVREIPTDAGGRMIINWAKPEPAAGGGRHISAAGVAEVWATDEAIRRNADLVRLACLEMADALSQQPDLLAAYADAEAGFACSDLLAACADVQITWSDLLAARRARYRAALFAPAERPDEPTDLAERHRAAEGRFDAGCEKVRAIVERVLAKARAAGSPPEGTAEQVKMLAARQKLVVEARGERAALGQRLSEARRRLRGRVAGKIVLVGSNSTGAPDFVPTPMHERTPGVVVHANILNTILSGRFVRRAPRWVAVALVLVAGLFVSTVAGRRGPIVASTALLVGMLAWTAIDLSVWATRLTWLVWVAPLAAMALAFGSITVYRQFTEARQKRQITGLFKQYLSPEMVDQLAANPELAALGGQQRTLSHLFSDLAGFTSLSERLGPAGTVSLLNRYLDRFGEVVRNRYLGTLSKYEGDAVYVFFGAPVPQTDHAARAIGAALDVQTLVGEVNEQFRAEGLLPEGASLSARVGVTTGPAIVGNMGSVAKKTYTAIGDSVNLAARLETANKFFGTRILADENAWRAGSDGVIGRPLGKVLVVGKTEPVGIWEPLARGASAEQSVRDLAEQFARGTELFAAGQFDQAAECFREILRRGPDPAAQTYLGLCERMAADPAAAANFDGVIRLTEK